MDIIKKAVMLAKERELDICLASTTGNTARSALRVIKDINYTGKFVVVRNVCGFHTPGETGMDNEIYNELTENGVQVITAAHALSGCERGISNKYSGVYPVQIIADSLRMLGQGVKVCVEISLMANDAGALQYGKPVVCVAGSGEGADTICIVTPAYSASVLNTKINEVIEKPDLY